MLFPSDIDTKSKITLFKQIVAQVIFEVAQGSLAVGELIPSVRELGDRLEVHGEQRDGSFVIKGPSGTTVAPGSIHPSNPWSAMVLDAHVMMSTRTGRYIIWKATRRLAGTLPT